MFHSSTSKRSWAPDKLRRASFTCSLKIPMVAVFIELNAKDRWCKCNLTAFWHLSGLLSTISFYQYGNMTVSLLTWVILLHLILLICLNHTLWWCDLCAKYQFNDFPIVEVIILSINLQVCMESTVSSADGLNWFSEGEEKELFNIFS